MCVCVCVRRGSVGISPQSAAVYADATCDPTESKFAAHNSPADPPEQSATTPGQSLVFAVCTVTRQRLANIFCPHNISVGYVVILEVVSVLIYVQQHHINSSSYAMHHAHLITCVADVCIGYLHGV